MGYRTYYTVTDLAGNDLSDDLEMSLRHAKRDTYSAKFYRGEEECKWYDHEDDLKFYSLLPKNKGVVIVCHGVGEEQGDVWDLYVKDGKSQLCDAIVMVAPYDESKLV